MKTKTKSRRSPAKTSSKETTLGKVWAELWGRTEDSDVALSSVGKGKPVDFVIVQKGNEALLCDYWFVSSKGSYSKSMKKGESKKISLDSIKTFTRHAEGDKVEEFDATETELVIPLNTKVKIQGDSIKMNVSEDFVVGASYLPVKPTWWYGSVTITFIKSSKVSLD